MRPSCTILAGWLVDGDGGPIQRRKRIRIRSGRIRDITPLASGRPPADVIDLSAHTLIPGLLDAHVHLTMPGDPDRQTRQELLNAGEDPVMEWISANLAAHRRHGVIAVRDGGDPAAHVARYKSRHTGPVEVRTSGWAWHVKGRYGRIIGKALDTPAALENVMLRTHQPFAVDQVKIVNSGLNSLLEFAKPTLPQFSAAQLTPAIAAARAAGLPVMVHANGRAPVRCALEAGCRSIEHGFFMGTENLAFMAENGTFWVPTAGTMQAYAENAPVQSREAKGARRNLAHQLEQIRIATKCGVRLCAGTDAGSPGVHHGAGLVREMRLLARAGLGIEDVIRCATGNPARLMDLDALGRIAPGKAAVFIAAAGPPEMLLDRLEAGDMILYDLRNVPPTQGESP